MRRSKAALRRTAIHEAGHAVVAEVLCLGCGFVTIIPNRDEQEAGHCVIPLGEYDVLAAWEARGRYRERRDWSLSANRAAAMTLLSGVAAERELLGRAGPGAGEDHRYVARLIEDFIPADGDVRVALRRLERAACGIVRRHRHSVAAVADELLLRRELAGGELQRIIASSRTAFNSAAV